MFITAMGGYPWGGSEELWARTAAALVRRGHQVAALVPRWPKLAPRLQAIQAAGVDVRMQRRVSTTLTARIRRALARRCGLTETADHRWLREWNADLVCVSHGHYYDGLEWMEYLTRQKTPLVSVSQANSEQLWPADATADRIGAALSAAKRVFFVSEANCRLANAQLGITLQNAEVVRNPFNVNWNVPETWPTHDEPTRLACVARLEPAAKGQDLLLYVLAKDKWRARPISVSFFGSGPMERSLKRLAGSLRLDSTVTFAGHVQNVESVWRDHHALVMPSRSEGLPLSLVEAMLCGRPSIVTNVAGNPELVQDNHTGFLAAGPTIDLFDEAMERAWRRRAEWKAIGTAARASVRERVPENPPEVFADRLVALAQP